MTTERSATVMDGIFASPEEESRGRLLKIMQDFLISEAAKHSAKEKGNVSLKLLIPSLKFCRESEGKAENNRC